MGSLCERCEREWRWRRYRSGETTQMIVESVVRGSPAPCDRIMETLKIYNFLERAMDRVSSEHINLMGYMCYSFETSCLTLFMVVDRIVEYVFNDHQNWKFFICLLLIVRDLAQKLREWKSEIEPIEFALCRPVLLCFEGPLQKWLDSMCWASVLDLADDNQDLLIDGDDFSQYNEILKAMSEAGFQ
jgi:hypothetical protein